MKIISNLKKEMHVQNLRYRIIYLHQDKRNKKINFFQRINDTNKQKVIWFCSTKLAKVTTEGGAIVIFLISGN